MMSYIGGNGDLDDDADVRVCVRITMGKNANVFVENSVINCMNSDSRRK